MKRQLLFSLALVMLLSLTACADTPAKNPSESTAGDRYECDLEYDMAAYAHFADIFDSKSAEEWNAMGRYTILLKGLHTPVTVQMDGMDVVSVRAFGQTAELGTAGGVFQDCCPVGIASTKDAVVVNVTWDYDGITLILTKDGCHELHPEGSVSTQVFVGEDGSLRYYRYCGEYLTTFEQYDYAPLDLCTSREHFLSESGKAEIVNNQIVLTPEETLTVSDKYDLDALFAQAKASGLYEGYQTVDELLDANGQSKTAPTKN